MNIFPTGGLHSRSGKPQRSIFLFPLLKSIGGIAEIRSPLSLFIPGLLWTAERFQYGRPSTPSAILL